MRLKYFPHILAAFVCSLAVAASSQALAPGNEYGLPITVGAGVGSFNPDFDNGRMLAGTLWINFKVPLPPVLDGLGFEIEGQDIAFNPNHAQSVGHIKEEVLSGGVTYSRWDFHRVHPYGKVLMGYGNADYPTRTGFYHQTRTVTTFGGGLTYPVLPAISLRAEYEYQYWPDFWIGANPNGAPLNPSGFTIGATYQLSSLFRHF
ncbi:MAG TPA: outer membrane beta-barrel protein [Acidobacteriaceae bacterium]|nr:outer membrane beta-barrel protein [Acidobacteriaceae bacterium]